MLSLREHFKGPPTFTIQLNHVFMMFEEGCSVAHRE